MTSLGGRPLALAEVTMMVGDGAARPRPARARRGWRCDPSTPGALARFLEIYDRRLLDHTVAVPRHPRGAPDASRDARGWPCSPTSRSRRLSGSWRHSTSHRFSTHVIGGDDPLGQKAGSGRPSMVDVAGARAARCSSATRRSTGTTAAGCRLLVCLGALRLRRRAVYERPTADAVRPRHPARPRPGCRPPWRGHVRKLIQRTSTSNFDAARMPIVNR